MKMFYKGDTVKFINIKYEDWYNKQFIVVASDPNTTSVTTLEDLPSSWLKNETVKFMTTNLELVSRKSSQLELFQ